MKPDDRTRAIQATVDHLDWLLDETYRRIWTAMEILGDTRTRAALASGSSEPGMPRGAGGHSDPTANGVVAAIEGHAAVADAGRARAIEDEASVVVDCAGWIHATLGGPIEPGHRDLAVARLQLEWHLTIPHTIGAWRTDDEHLLGELDHAVELLASTTRTLRHDLVEKVLRSSIRPPQQRIKRCVSCNRAGLVVGIEVGRYARYCRRCGDFRAQHKVDPSPAICLMWDRGSNRVTPGMILEAKAGARKGRRKRGA